MASEWLEWKAKQLGQHIRHKYNDTEKRLRAEGYVYMAGVQK